MNTKGGLSVLIRWRSGQQQIWRLYYFFFFFVSPHTTCLRYAIHRNYKKMIFERRSPTMVRLRTTTRQQHLQRPPHRKRLPIPTTPDPNRPVSSLLPSKRASFWTTTTTTTTRRMSMKMKNDSKFASLVRRMQAAAAIAGYRANAPFVCAGIVPESSWRGRRRVRTSFIPPVSKRGCYGRMIPSVRAVGGTFWWIRMM